MYTYAYTDLLIRKCVCVSSIHIDLMFVLVKVLRSVAVGAQSLGLESLPMGKVMFYDFGGDF